MAELTLSAVEKALLVAAFKVAREVIEKSQAAEWVITTSDMDQIRRAVTQSPDMFVTDESLAPKAFLALGVAIANGDDDMLMEAGGKRAVALLKKIKESVHGDWMRSVVPQHFQAVDYWTGRLNSGATLPAAAAELAAAAAEPVAPAIAGAAKIVLGGQALWRTLNAAMKAAVASKSPIGMVPAVVVNTVKDQSRTAKKQIELQVVSPRLGQFLARLGSFIQANPDELPTSARLAIDVAGKVYNTTLLGEGQVDTLRSRFDPKDHGEQYKALIKKQEAAARAIITSSGILDRIPMAGVLGIDWFARAGSFYSEHPLLAPHYRAYQILAGVRFTRENIEDGLALVRAIVRSGAYNDLRFIEDYIKPLGKADFRPLSELVAFIQNDNHQAFDLSKADWDSYITANRAKLVAFAIKRLEVGRDYSQGEALADLTDKEGLQILPQLTDAFNREMQKQREMSARVATGVLRGFVRDMLKGGGSTADRLFLSLAEAVRETEHFSDIARQIILSGALAGLTDQLEETELHRRPVGITLGGPPPEPDNPGIYFLPVPRAYAALLEYVRHEVAHLSNYPAPSRNKAFENLKAMEAVVAEMARVSSEATRETEGKPGERLLPLPQQFADVIFKLIESGVIGAKKMTITRLGGDLRSGTLMHFATGRTRAAGWETSDGGEAFVPVMNFHEVESAASEGPIDPLSWRQAMEANGMYPDIISTIPDIEGVGMGPAGFMPPRPNLIFR